MKKNVNTLIEAVSSLVPR